jgi:hypothetical protein
MFPARPSFSTCLACVTALLFALGAIGCSKRDPGLAVSTDEIDFGADLVEVSFTVFNASEDRTLTAGVETLDYVIEDNAAWLTVEPASGNCGEGQRNTHVARIDRAKLVLGNNVATIEISSNGGSGNISVQADRLPSTCTDLPTEPWNPTPGVNTTGVAIDADLVWSDGTSTCPGLTATYDVYFGTTSPPPLHHNNGSTKSWDPGPMSYGMTYYWRIVATDANGSTSGAEWRFTTSTAPCTSPPSAPSAPTPANGATTVSINQDLSWSGGDSQCPGLLATYDVYFGTTSPPPLHHSNGTVKAWNPPSLSYGTTYYWRIVATDPNGSTSSAEWSFVTEAQPCTAAPSAVTLLAPANRATGINVNAHLSWSGGDSQCPGLTATYTVYFGTTSPPPLRQSNVTSKTFDPGTMTFDTAYYWRIVAVDANGSTTSAEWTFVTALAPCTTKPSAVTLLSPANAATGISVNANLSWTGGDSQCPGLSATYNVYFGKTSPPPLDHNNGGGKSWDPGTLEYNTPYYWRVVAVDANGSTSSAEWTFRTELAPCTSAPSAVTLLAPPNGATGVSINQNLSWTGGDSQCPGLSATYNVYFGKTSPPPLDHNNGGGKSWDPGVLEYNTAYYWRVVAVDPNGSTSSAEWSFVTQLAPCTSDPSPVTLLAPLNGATDVSINQNLSWSGGDSQCPGLNATYNVYFGKTSPPPLDHNNGSGKLWDPGTLEYNTAYYWRIVATDPNGSTSSAEWSFVTELAPCTSDPSAVTLLAPPNGATGVSINQNLSWTGGDSQCPGLTTTYNVYFGTTSPPPLHHNNGTSKTWDPGTLANNTAYYWRVVAVDANGSTSSAEWSFVTEVAACTDGPGTVTIVAPSDGASDTSISQNVSWAGGNSQCPGLTATYDVYFGTTSPPPFDHNNGTSKTWDPGALEYSTTYYWRIVAKDNNGESSGPVWSFTTEVPCLAPPSAPCAPNPADGKENVSENANLAWGCGDSQCLVLVTYDVYFGISPTLGTEDLQGSTIVKSWNLARLDKNTTYYWKIVAHDLIGETPGPVWSFTTKD